MWEDDYLTEYDRPSRQDYERWEQEKYERQRQIDRETMSPEQFEDIYHEHSTPF